MTRLENTVLRLSPVVHNLVNNNQSLLGVAIGTGLYTYIYNDAGCYVFNP